MFWKRVCWGSGPKLRRDRNETQRLLLLPSRYIYQSPLSSIISALFFLLKKGKGKFRVYLRPRRMSAAATAMMTITAAPTAIYVVVGCALVGGMIAGLGVGAIVADGDAVGAIV